MPHFSREESRRIVRETYGSVEGRSTAVAESIYDPAELASLPEDAVRMALGVGHPIRHARLQPGETVLDLGAGAGIDTLLAAQQVGPTGRVIGLDMTPEMVRRARSNATAAGLDNATFIEAYMEEIPLDDASVDVVISNGTLNLSTRESRVIAETFRVLRPGGRISFADLVVTEKLPDVLLRNPAAFSG